MCWQQAKGPVVLSEFGAQWTVLWDEMGAYLDRGGRVFGCLDQRQFHTPSEQKAVKPFLAIHPEPFRSWDIVAGNSQYASQILHDKKTVWNAPVNGYVPAIGDYDTVEDAFAAGACVSWFGSLNLSVAASKQANTICIMPGIVVGAMFVEDIMQNHDFICARQPQYQPFPKPTGSVF
jgi:hypothetical protein